MRSTRPTRELFPIGEVLRRVGATDILELVPALTLCLLIFHGFSAWHFRLGMLFLTVAALLHRPLLQNPVFWLAATGLTAFKIIHFWYPIDNHKFVLSYWCAVLFLSFCLAREEDRRFVIQSNARFFLIAIMGLAVFQKAISQDYMSGDFFYYTFLTDARFETFLNVFGVSSDLLRDNRETVRELKDAYLTLDVGEVGLRSQALIGVLAVWVTWWVILIEAAIAIAFVIRRDGADLVGHVLLLVFIISTYAVAPVIGFGFTLIILGLALCSLRQSILRWSYFGSLFLIEIYGAPWRQVLQI